MDFSKPYEPSSSTAAKTVEPAAEESQGRKRGSQMIPALFRKKAA